MTSRTDISPWLEAVGAPSVPGLRFRMWRDEADWEPIADVMRATCLADGVPWIATADLLRIEHDGYEGVDPRRDIVLAEVDGRIVASSEVDRVVRDGEPMYELSGLVDPAFRRRGIGAALHAWNVRRAHERAAQYEPGQPVTLQAGAEEGEVGNTALLVSRGFENVRRFYLMRRDLAEPIAAAPLPDGIEIRTVSPDQHRPIWDAENEAFRDHWGHREPTEHGFDSTYGRKELDTDLWIVAWEGDQIAGVIQNWIWPEENATLGVERGWLEKVCVRRPWRRRGLGRALTALSLERLRAAGLREAMLGVDATNPTGALGVYESNGFEVYRREVAYRRVDPA
jgi:mycothiol synthase